MSVFDEIQIDSEGNIVYNKWIEWDHFLIPNKPELLRNFMREFLAFLGHCKKCSALDGCYLLENNRPEQPLHPNCDCKRTAISTSIVKKQISANCPLTKFTEYIFKNKDKKILFESWGFKIQDSNMLKTIIELQASENYKLGKYVLKSLDIFGQRLAIPVNLNGRSFYTGWLLCPEGLIKNTTPFGGWIK